MELEFGTAYGVSGDHHASLRLFHRLAMNLATMGESVLILSPILAPTATHLASMQDGRSPHILNRIHLAFVSDIAHVASTLASIETWSATTRCLFVDTTSLCPPVPDVYEVAHIRSVCLALKRIATVYRAIVVIAFPSTMTQWYTSHHVLLTACHPSTSTTNPPDAVTVTIARTGATCSCSLSTFLST
ncbi:hypothetical protein H257_18123 [Aphanomyces astaci]|uniref:Uncharacterized protein n=1 Tax=Aphanomyces astaci TaxID=112090 RepID=W4FDY6_APHAT|nr:hypothetical protein H257_18123 [Aphanomyces astaci]ETV65074.1 hypothetical protein H257_18123 [Aphanomyces astaci]|eukprot:XP_009845433.1 hypothetical protein H257_18123 [Aphanomyces astaci]